MLSFLRIDACIASCLALLSDDLPNMCSLLTFGKPSERNLFGILRIPPFVNHKGKDVNSDSLAGQWDERSVLGHARINKGRMKGDDPEIDERLSLIVSRTRMAAWPCLKHGGGI